MRMCETMSARVDQASSAYIGILWLDDYKAIWIETCFVYIECVQNYYREGGGYLIQVLWRHMDRFLMSLLETLINGHFTIFSAQWDLGFIHGIFYRDFWMWKFIIYYGNFCLWYDIWGLAKAIKKYAHLYDHYLNSEPLSFSTVSCVVEVC